MTHDDEPGALIDIGLARRLYRLVRRHIEVLEFLDCPTAIERGLACELMDAITVAEDGT